MKFYSLPQLYSFHAQLIDLKTGYLEEIVIKNNDKADVLREILMDVIKEQEKMIERDKEMSNQEKQQQKCPKCGTDIKGDDEGLCVNCI